jgi:ABC-type polysaccharide/polyol phosphate transport system ATPase subunit
MPAEMEAKIIFDNASVRYRLPKERIRTIKEFAIKSLWRQVDYEEFWALRHISLQVSPGEMLGIIGRNGAGKSTLLKLVARVMQPVAGSVKANGRVTPLLELGAGFDSELTGRENVFLFGSLLGISRREMHRRIAKICAFSELQDFLDAPLRTFSSGMITRLGFSVATSVEPDILLLDEILSVGDGNFQKKSLDLIDQFRLSGVTILFVSHDLPKIRSSCDRVVWLDQGEVQAWGETGSVLDQYESFLRTIP